MRKNLVNLVILAIFLLPLMSAVEVDMQNEFKRGDILTAKISGNFLGNIIKENIYFYRDEIVKVPFEFELLKIEEDYFISTQTAGKTPGNYLLVIKDTEYYASMGEVSSEDIIANFSILEDLADFSVKPGVLTAKGPFSIELQNLKDSEIIVSINKDSEDKDGFFSFLFQGGKGQEYSLKAGEVKQITLEFQNISTSELKTIKLSTEDFSTEIFVYALPFEKEMEISEKVNETISNETISNITEANKTEGEKLPSVSQTCPEINGSICERAQKCDGEQITAQDGICCLGQCVEKKKSSAGKIIGWSLVVILVALYIWFYANKYKKTKKKVDLLKVAEGRK